ncbi:hypothetical protein SALBM217S_07227 [Streptomyces griseoloalbus]
MYFLGGGFLELSGRAEAAPAGSPDVRLWLQVEDAEAARRNSPGAAWRSSARR